MLPQRYTPDGEVSYEFADEVTDPELKGILDQQRLKDSWCNIGTWHVRKR